MASVFTRIIEGELPAQFVWKDPWCVAFMSTAPLREGHTLVVPKKEIDHWLDLDNELAAHLIRVSKSIGKAIQSAFDPEKVGLLIAGLEVPHVHIHVSPIDDVGDLDFANADADAAADEIGAAAERIRAELRSQGTAEVSD